MATIDPTGRKEQNYCGELTYDPPPPHLPKVIELDDLCTVAGHSTLYVQGISTGDVRQGAVDDCTLHATLVSLARTAEGQQLIKDKIQVRTDAAGCECYRVSVFKKNATGGFDAVKVDVSERDFAGTGLMKPDLNAAGQSEAWPRVIEAAILKANPSVDTPIDALGMLTGRTPTISSTQASDFATRLQLGFETKKVQVLLTSGVLKADITTPVLLKANHAYAIVAVRTLYGQTSVTLRNPWGYDDPVTLSVDQLHKYFGAYSEGTVQ